MRRIVISLATVLTVLATGCGSTGSEGAETTAPPETFSASPTTRTTTASTTTVPATTTSTAPKPADARASKLLQGNGSPAIPAGEPGKLSVVELGPIPAATGVGATVPVIVRNNTSSVIGRISATGRARLNGALVGSGSDQGFEPAVVQPGEIALGYVFFESDLDPAAQVEIVATGDKEASKIGLDVTETNVNGTTIVGVLTSTSDKTIGGPISVYVACFDGNGKVITVVGAYTNENEVSPKGTASFSTDLYDQPCPTYLVGASGYDL